MALGQFGAAGITISPVIAGLGVGVALSSAPSPVQAVLLAESALGALLAGFGGWLLAAGLLSLLTG